MELGMRLNKISQLKRKASRNFVYEINDVPYKNNIRDDVMMRRLWQVDNITANDWKPNERQLMAYERWHRKNKGDLDENWKAFMQVPCIDMKRAYLDKKEGEIVYESK